MKKMILNGLIVFAIAFGSLASLAQSNFEWVRTMGGTSNDVGRDVVIDDFGNVYTLGEFQGVADFDPSAGVVNLTTFGSTDIFLQKMDANGNLLWVKQIGGTNTDNAVSIAIDGNGDLVVAGQFKGTADFDPSAGVNTLTAVGNYFDTYIAKFDNNGNLIWVKRLDSTHSIYAVELGISPTNEVVLTGRWFQTADFDPGVGVSNMTAIGSGWDAYILKLTSNGNFVWAKQIKCTDNMYNQALAIDLSGNVLIGGYYYATIDVDPGPGSVTYNGSINQEDMFIVKLDNNGSYVWSKNYSASATEMINSIHVDANNDYYFGGWFSSALNFNPGGGSMILTPTGGSGADAFLFKLNSSGVLQWVNQMGGASSSDELWSISSDSQGDIVATGTFTGTVDLDPGASTANYTSAGFRDVFIQKVSPNGTHQWSQVIGGTGNDFVNSVAVGPNDEIYTTGNFYLTADFNPGTGVVSVTSAGGGDVYVHKLSNCVPSAPTPNVANLSDLLGDCTVAAPAAPTASSCGSTFVGTPDVTFPITTPGTTVVTWTYDDGNGNTSTQTQNIVINDATAPVANIASLSNITAECSVTSLSAPTATDNCSGSITGTHNATLPITTQGTTAVTWTYDDGNGNTSSQTQNVVINDVSAPIADIVSLSDVTADCEVTSLIPPTATDNCSGSITGTHNATLPITTQGTTAVTWTYVDGNGNTSTQMQDVVITPIDNGITQVDAVTLIADASGYTYQWIDCDNGNAEITGETGQTFEATMNGNYAVIVDNGSCSETSICIAIDQVSIQEEFIDRIKIYPNPTEGTITISASSEFNRIEVLNAMGQIVNSIEINQATEYQFELREPNGIYMIRVSGVHSQQTFRINKK